MLAREYVEALQAHEAKEIRYTVSIKSCKANPANQKFHSLRFWSLNHLCKSPRESLGIFLENRNINERIRLRLIHVLSLLLLLLPVVINEKWNLIFLYDMTEQRLLQYHQKRLFSQWAGVQSKPQQFSCRWGGPGKGGWFSWCSSYCPSPFSTWFWFRRMSSLMSEFPLSFMLPEDIREGR